MADNGGRYLPLGEAGGLLFIVAPPTMYRLTWVAMDQYLLLKEGTLP